jgi:hypothetical protein
MEAAQDLIVVVTDPGPVPEITIEGIEQRSHPLDHLEPAPQLCPVQHGKPTWNN